MSELTLAVGDKLAKVGYQGEHHVEPYFIIKGEVQHIFEVERIDTVIEYEGGKAVYKGLVKLRMIE